MSVEDNTKPVITCPSNITVPADNSVCEAVVTYALPSFNNNCMGSVLTQTDITGLVSGSSFSLGSTTLSYLVTDAVGQTASCTFDVLVEDTQGPTVTCPSDAIVSVDNGICGAVYTYPDFVEGVTMFDNCTGITVTKTDVTGFNSGDVFPVGTTNLSYEIKDGSDNKIVCAFAITVADDELPTIICPSDTIISVAPGLCERVFTYTLPVASDNCTGFNSVFVSGIERGNSFPLGSTSIVYEVTDASNHKTQCTFDVTVVDDIKPTIKCLNDTTIYVGTSCDVAFTFNLESSDNCTVSPAISFVSGFATGVVLNIGDYDYEIVVEDNAGNVSDTCKFTVSVEDNTKPVITCPPSELLCVEQVYNFPLATVSDHCTNGIVPLQSSGKTSGEVFGIGQHSIVFTATDLGNNSANCSFTITVFDTTQVPDINGGDTLYFCDTTVTLSVNNTGFSTGSWKILSGQGKIDLPNQSTTVMDSLAYGSSVRVAWESTFGQCATKLDSSLVIIKTPPTASGLLFNYLLCDDATIDLSAISNADSVKWVQTSGSSVSISADSLLATTLSGFDNNDLQYTFNFVASTFTCPDSIISFVIDASTNPEITISEDTAVYLGESVTLEVSANMTADFEWLDVGNVSLSLLDFLDVSPIVTTMYYVSAVNIKGCMTTDSVKVIFKDDIKIYTGVTPNGDGINDVWYIRGMKSHPDAEVSIFTQWGQPIFNSTGYDKPWDATHNEEGVPFGVYYYIVDLKNGSTPQTGTITVLK